MLCCCVWIITLLIKSPCCYLFAWSIGWCCLMLPYHYHAAVWSVWMLMHTWQYHWMFKSCCSFEVPRALSCFHELNMLSMLLCDLLVSFVIWWLWAWDEFRHAAILKPSYCFQKSSSFVLIAVSYMLYKHHECIIVWCPCCCLIVIC